MLHILTFGSDPERFQHLKNTEKLFNAHIHYLTCDFYEAFISKLVAVMEYIMNPEIPNDDIICFIDGYDVLMNSSIEEIMEKFLAKGADLVFSAEMNFCGGSEDGIQRKIYDIIHAGFPTNFKYINAGGYIGYKHTVAKFLNWQPYEDIRKLCVDLGDQAYCHYYFLHNIIKYKDAESIAVDYQCDIFQSMYLVDWNEVGFCDGRFFNKVLEIKPCFIHFNGSSYQYMDGRKNDSNIMPVFVEKMIQSAQNKDTVFDLRDYEPSKYKHRNYGMSQLSAKK